MEDGCLSRGFKVLVNNTSGTDLEYPISEEGLKAGQNVAGTLSCNITVGVSSLAPYSSLTKSQKFTFKSCSFQICFAIGLLGLEKLRKKILQK